MTVLAEKTATAIETLKRYAKPIPFGETAPSELRNIQRLMHEGRHAEAEQRLTRLFNDGWIIEAGN